MAQASLLLLTYAVAAERAANQPQISRAMQPVIHHFLTLVRLNQQLAASLMSLESFLYDIPDAEWDTSREFIPRRHRTFGTLRGDMESRKMTNFSLSQLERLFELFGLRQYIAARNWDGEIRVPTGHTNRRGVACYYNFDPEELVLFTLTKCKTGMKNNQLVDTIFGGAYSRWSYGYRWMIFYLDDRYRTILGHGCLLRYLPDFMTFRNAIERYVQKDKVYYDNAGNRLDVQGLAHLPFNIFGFIDDSIEKIQVPYSGPEGDYEGAPRREQYMNGQEAVYSGWKKIHGIKNETVYLPNGICTLYGAESARENDRGTLNRSNLDAFVGMIQTHLPLNLRCKLFGDGIFHGALQNIITYFRSIGNVPLSYHELTTNAAMRSSRMPIEKFYAHKDNLWDVCAHTAGHLAKKHPYAIEQLRIVYLLTNCFNCFNGDQGGSVNTFGLTPPRIEEYLAL